MSIDFAGLNRQLAALRGQPVAVGAQVVGELLDELVELAADERVTDETAVNLLARALRAVRPREPRPDSREAAVAALRQAIEEGPRKEGKPPENVTPRTVRASEETWTAVDAYAQMHGISESKAGGDLLAKVVEAIRRTTCASLGCSRAATVQAGPLVYCGVGHVPVVDRVAVEPLGRLGAIDSRP